MKAFYHSPNPSPTITSKSFWVGSWKPFRLSNIWFWLSFLGRGGGHPNLQKNLNSCIYSVLARRLTFKNKIKIKIKIGA
jgi:hypothetical protein